MSSIAKPQIAETESPLTAANGSLYECSPITVDLEYTRLLQEPFDYRQALVSSHLSVYGVLGT